MSHYNPKIDLQILKECYSRYKDQPVPWWQYAPLNVNMQYTDVRDREDTLYDKCVYSWLSGYNLLMASSAALLSFKDQPLLYEYNPNALLNITEFDYDADCNIVPYYDGIKSRSLIWMFKDGRIYRYYLYCGGLISNARFNISTRYPSHNVIKKILNLPTVYKDIQHDIYNVTLNFIANKVNNNTFPNWSQQFGELLQNEELFYKFLNELKQGTIIWTK